jgi:hypothetical protein
LFLNGINGTNLHVAAAQSTQEKFSLQKCCETHEALVGTYIFFLSIPGAQNSSIITKHPQN